MHHDTIARVLYAPMGWYEATPSGRVLSRFTSDLNAVDVRLSMDVDNLIQMIFMAGTLVGFIAASSWQVLYCTTVLCYTILYNTVLYFAVLYYISLYCTKYLL